MKWASPVFVTVTALIVFSPFVIAQFRSESRLVEVYATVHDQKGHPVDGLQQDRFQVLENGSPQRIYSFESDFDELSCAILLDTTGSMRDALGSVKNAVSNLLEQLRPGDSVAIFSFSTSLVTLQDFTTDKAAARRAVLRTRAQGETALFDAVAQVASEISSRPGKKAIVLFTDGADNASHLIADSAIRRALKTGVPIYAVAEGSAVEDGVLLKQLKSLAERTGGLCYRARSSHDVAAVFDDIQAELKHIYRISYRPLADEDTAWRTIQLTVVGGKDFKVRGKQGYFPH